MAVTAVCLLLRGGIAVAVRSNNVWADKLHAARYEWSQEGINNSQLADWSCSLQMEVRSSTHIVPPRSDHVCSCESSRIVPSLLQMNPQDRVSHTRHLHFCC
jgi:hypothetical protein